ncbi:hypothetical protein IWW56_003891 [Coemansia sp. RSA 2131]|nr:hypothetical protein IWW56_003891 [Coemansia sp. RSA 2131]
MRTMWLLDRHLRTESDEALGSTAHTQRSTSGRTTQDSISRMRLPLNLGDTRAQLAPLCLTQTETLMVIAGRFAQARAGADMQGVRPRASMPLINGMHRPPQWTCSHVARKMRDELSGALTMKSVEICGGRIVLDDPSSSEDIASDIGSVLTSVSLQTLGWRAAEYMPEADMVMQVAATAGDATIGSASGGVSSGSAVGASIDTVSSVDVMVDCYSSCHARSGRTANTNRASEGRVSAAYLNNISRRKPRQHMIDFSRAIC